MPRIVCLIFLFVLIQQKANAQYFDIKYNNYAKWTHLQGKVRELKVSNYSNGRSRDTSKKELESMIIFKFNPDGNLTERSQFRANGEPASRDVYTYHKKNGQMISHSFYKEGEKAPASISTIKRNVSDNTLSVDYTNPRREGVFSTSLYKSNKRGKLISVRHNMYGKQTGTDYLYDDVKHTVRNVSLGTKSYSIDYYDQKGFRIGTAYFDDQGQLKRHCYLLNDRFGNVLEYGVYGEMSKRKEKIHSSIYTYDQHNNWLSLKNTSSSSIRWEERNIVYY